jgi:hypothetical protein
VSVSGSSILYLNPSFAGLAAGLLDNHGIIIIFFSTAESKADRYVI